MSKRSADRELTKDNCNYETKSKSGTWSCATKEQISKRKLVKVRRKSSTGSKPATPVSKYPSFNQTKKETKKEPVNAFAKLIPANTWECQVCLVRNKNEQMKCAACGEPKPGVAAKDIDAKHNTSDTKNGSIFTFGSTNNSSQIQPSTTGFTFGSTSSTSSTAAPAAGFAFGSDNPFAFDTNKKSGSLSWGGGTSNFAWGNVAPSSTETGKESTANSSKLFQFTTQQSLSKPGETSPGKAAFQPEKEQKSGEEKDRLLYKVHTKVYTLKQVPIIKATEVGDNKKDDGPPKMKEKYVESGSGELHMNVIEEKDSTRARMVLRVAKTQRLVLNAPIFPGMLYSKEGDKYVRFTSNNLDGNSVIFLLKLRNKTETSEVVSYIKKCISMVKTTQKIEKKIEDKVTDENEGNKQTGEVRKDEDEEDEEESQV